MIALLSIVAVAGPLFEGLSVEQWGCDPTVDRLACDCVAAWQHRNPIDLSDDKVRDAVCIADVGGLGSVVCAYEWQRHGAYVTAWDTSGPVPRPIVVVTDERGGSIEPVWTCLDLEYQRQPPPQAQIRRLNAP